MKANKTSPYAKYATSARLETDGIDLDFGDFKIFVRRAGGANKDFGIALERNMGPHKLAFRNETLDPEKARAIMVKTYAEAVVTGWEDVCDLEGKPIPFSVDNCVKLFTDLPDLFAEVQEQSSRMANFRAEQVEAVKENLGNS